MSWPFEVRGSSKNLFILQRNIFVLKKAEKGNQMASPFLFLVELYFWKTKKSKLETALL